jgi:hypothetical protein
VRHFDRVTASATAAPSGQHLAEGNDRSLIRRAMRESLPECLATARARQIAELSQPSMVRRVTIRRASTKRSITGVHRQHTHGGNLPEN